MTKAMRVFSLKTLVNNLDENLLEFLVSCELNGGGGDLSIKMRCHSDCLNPASRSRS